jgi:hypothetical protein
MFLNMILCSLKSEAFWNSEIDSPLCNNQEVLTQQGQIFTEF